VTAAVPAAPGFAPGQLPDTTLFVPIDVQALAIGPNGEQAVPTETVVPISAPNSPESATLPRPPQPFGAPLPRPPGVHLHWAMPDALTRGDAGTTGDDPVSAGNPTNLRALPDRWLVVRMQYRTEGCEAFMIDADLQRHIDLVNWIEPTPLSAGTVTTPQGRWYYPGTKLTAVAGGDVAWAATYDAVVDRFGFHDPLLGVPQTKGLSYLVIGWWSNPANNPLFKPAPNLQHYRRVLENLGWDGPNPVQIPPAPTPRAPTLTMLHGLISGVAASGVGSDMRPDPTNLEIGLGGTGFGALAAQLGEGTAEERAASERLLAAFASGLLDRVDEPDGLVAIDEDRHASGFVAVSAGTSAQPDRVAEGDPFAGTTTPGPTPIEPPSESAVPAATLEHRDVHEVLSAALESLPTAGLPGPIGTPAPPSSPQTFRDVPTSRPRYFVPGDLALALHGARRSLRHGEDNNLTFNGLTPCRLSHDLRLLAGGVLSERSLPPGLRVLPSTRIPPECEWLLREAVLVDPSRAGERRAWAGQAPTTADRKPFWVVNWFQPWVPLWCDWELGVRVDDDLRRWALREIELEPKGMPDGPSEIVVSGRMLLHASAGRAFGGQIRAWLEEEQRRDDAGLGHVAEADEFTLMAAASAAEGRDLLTGSFRGLREELLGLDPQRALVTRIDAAGRPIDKPPIKAQPKLLAGGAATVRRLRVVDALGRWLDVPDTILSKLEVAATHLHPAGAPRFTLAPRFQRPARLQLRFVDPRPADTASPVEAVINQENPLLAVSPIAGWLLADHVDEALECFDAEGRPIGQLMHDALTEAVVFEEAPGKPGSIGGPPASPDPATRHVMRFAAGLVGADAAARNAPAGPPDESALSVFLRGIDTTLWTVDPLGSVGTAAVAGLVGRPIAVVRALLSLDVLSDVDEVSYRGRIVRADRARAYAELAARAITVRLGELTRTDDGLLAYFVDDDYGHVRLVAPDILTQARASGARAGQLGVAGGVAQPPPSILPLEHPYTGGRTDVLIRSGQTLRLTLLMHPGGRLHVTSGVAPRKALALARDWFHEPLERISPSFRVGPVLVDPTGIRMPRVTGLGDRQTFTRRTTPLTWRDDPILASSQTALLPDDPAGLQEGWIRVVPEGTQ
jgi:hypothetical protein